MSKDSHVLDLPVEKASNVNEVVDFFSKKKIWEKDYSVIRVTSVILDSNIWMTLALALLRLEEQGKLKLTGHKRKHSSAGDFLRTFLQKETESEIEKLIRYRYSLNVVFTQVKKEQKKTDLSLDDVFGMWKDQKVNLNKVRESQWAKRG